MSSHKNTGRRGPDRRCAATGKVRFRTPNDAKMALRSAQTMRALAAGHGFDTHRRELRWYECSLDGVTHYHLTSKPSREAVREAVLTGLARVAAASFAPA